MQIGKSFMLIMKTHPDFIYDKIVPLYSREGMRESKCDSFANNQRAEKNIII
jgi:hypothetical protein